MMLFAVGSYSQPNSAAMEKARQAAMIQSGAQRVIDQTTAFAEGRAKMYIERVGVERPVAAIGVAYKIYHDKAIQVKEFRNPIIPGCRNYATIGLNEATVGFRWYF